MTEPYSLHHLRLHAAGERLPAALAQALPVLSQTKLRQAVVAGLVQVAGEIITDPTWTLPDNSVGVRVDLRQGLRAAKGRGSSVGPPFRILYEDDHLLVLDKAAGILSAPFEQASHGHIPELLRRHFRKHSRNLPYIGVVHRLDKETSGCLCVALDRRSQELLNAQFAGGSAARHYRCLVLGQPKQDQDTLTARLGRGADGRRCVVRPEQAGKDAITHFQVMERYNQGAELAVQLETGRTHQIRIHLAAIGCPVAGDAVYDRLIHKRIRGRPRAPRLMLHAERLLLDHPRTGERLDIEAPLPQALTDFRRRLQG
ncbi:MAG: RluA family pseudouridine synthase [Planctomycetota bacterium]